MSSTRQLVELVSLCRFYASVNVNNLPMLFSPCPLRSRGISVCAMEAYKTALNTKRISNPESMVLSTFMPLMHMRGICDTGEVGEYRIACNFGVQFDGKANKYLDVFLGHEMVI